MIKASLRLAGIKSISYFRFKEHSIYTAVKPCMKNILFFGDSLTAGYGLANASQESYPALINKKILETGLDFKVINAGLSGDTSAGGLRRIDYWISQPVDIFILELGINDIIRGISPQIILGNLQAIINKVKLKYPAVKLVLMGMQIPAYIPSALAIPFNAIYEKIAKENNMAFFPFFLKGCSRESSAKLTR